MRIIKSRVRYKEPETFDKAKEQEMNQKPYKPVYATEAYEANIKQAAEDAVADDYLRDVHVAQRVIKAQEALDAGKVPAGENKWFIERVNENSGNRFLIEATGTYCSVTGGGRIREGKTVTLTATPDTYYHCDSTSWVGVPSTATFSADYKSVSWTVDAEVTGIVCTAVENAKYALSFSTTHSSTITAVVDGVGITSGDSVYESATVVMTVTLGSQCYMNEAAWGTMPTGTTYNADYTVATFTMPSSATTIAVVELLYVELDLITTNCTIVAKKDGVVVSLPYYGKSGDIIVATITEDEHCTWDGWYSGGSMVSSDNPKTFTVGSSDEQYIATCKLKKHVLASCVLGTISPAEGWYDEGDTVTLVVTAQSATSTLKYGMNADSDWSGLPTGATFSSDFLTATFTITDDVLTAKATCKAIEVKITAVPVHCTITVKRNDTGASIVNTWVPLNTSCTAECTPDSGYRFVQWNNGYTSNPQSFTALESTYDWSCTCTDKYLVRFATGSSSKDTVVARVAGVAQTSPFEVATGTSVTFSCTLGASRAWDSWKLILTDSAGSSTTTFPTDNPFVLTITDQDVDITSLTHSDVWLTFTNTSGAEFTISSSSGNIEFATNKSGTPHSSATGSTVYARTASAGAQAYGITTTSGTFDKVSGPLMALVDYENYDTATMSDYQFCDGDATTDPTTGLFSDCAGLTDISGLEFPDHLSKYCYAYMFSNCTSLADISSISLTSSIAEYCYAYMFSGCSSLVDASSLTLPTSTAAGCYYYMFAGAGLTNYDKCPDLSSILTLSENCYSGMFCECEDLAMGPYLPALTVPSGAYQDMFSGCTSLTDMYSPVAHSSPIKATTFTGEYNMAYMFADCTSLQYFYGWDDTTSTGWSYLLVEDLTSHCYYKIFSGCTSLTGVYLKAKTNIGLGSMEMWNNNTSSTTANTLYGDFAQSPSALPAAYPNVIPDPETGSYEGGKWYYNKF